jgi:3-methyladenine DNA glycosylase AlkD
VNNWDLVDLTADKIVGEHLLGKDTTLLSILASSTMLWDRRIAIVATYAFIKQNQFKETLRIAGMLLNDRHDLMHKAVGWMLREVGKRDQQAEEEFLKKHYHQMPRTMLRYAIERFSDEKRQQYMKK